VVSIKKDINKINQLSTLPKYERL